MKQAFLLVAALALTPMASIAQVPQDATRGCSASLGGPASAPAASVGTSARDGCVNVPGVPHNSADCSRIPRSDYNTARNDFSTDLSGKPTGATENAARNQRIMTGQASN